MITLLNNGKFEQGSVFVAGHFTCFCLQRCDSVGWASGRASGL